MFEWTIQPVLGRIGTFLCKRTNRTLYVTTSCDEEDGSEGGVFAAIAFGDQQ